MRSVLSAIPGSRGGKLALVLLLVLGLVAPAWGGGVDDAGNGGGMDGTEATTAGELPDDGDANPSAPDWLVWLLIFGANLLL